MWTTSHYRDHLSIVLHIPRSYNFYFITTPRRHDQLMFGWFRSLSHYFTLKDHQTYIYSDINSSPPSAAYMGWWIGLALVQIMACRLFGAKPLSKPILGHCQLDPMEQTSVKFFIKNTKLFIHKNAYENMVYQMVTILSRRRWVNSLWPSDAIWRQRSGSTLAQVMACCLTAPSHYLNQCWLIISEV